MADMPFRCIRRHESFTLIRLLARLYSSATTTTPILYREQNYRIKSVLIKLKDVIPAWAYNSSLSAESRIDGAFDNGRKSPVLRSIFNIYGIVSFSSI